MRAPSRNRKRRRALMRPFRVPVRVLLVLESHLAAGHVNTALDDARYETRTANTQADAARMLAAWRPHAVILDLDLDSREVPGRIQAMAPRVPMIALTQNGDLTTKLAAMSAPTSAVMSPRRQARPNKQPRMSRSLRSCASVASRTPPPCEAVCARCSPEGASLSAD